MKAAKDSDEGFVTLGPIEVQCSDFTITGCTVENKRGGELGFKVRPMQVHGTNDQLAAEFWSEGTSAIEIRAKHDEAWTKFLRTLRKVIK